MAAKYNSRIGISEVTTSYRNALKLIGSQDANGDTIGIAYISSSPFNLIPLALRTIIFIILALAIFIQIKPFGWMPVSENEPELLLRLVNWNIGLTFFSWFLIMLFYSIYYVICLWKNNIYMGLVGAEIHFTRHNKICHTLKAGKKKIFLDPRVKPYAVVSTKDVVLNMPEVVGKTKDQITLTFKGALIAVIQDTYKLLERGGFEKFVEQLRDKYESIIKDLIVETDAVGFNTFLIEPVAIKELESGAGSTDELSFLDRQELDVSLISRLSEIKPVDVSGIELVESSGPERKIVSTKLQNLASDYGITILDHIPLGNSISEGYLSELSVKLISALERLIQAAEALLNIKEDEKNEEITTAVSSKKIGDLQVKRIISEIDSVKEALIDTKNIEAIKGAKTVAAKNIAHSVLAPVVAKADALLAQINAETVATAGLERYVEDYRKALDEIKKLIQKSMPKIESVVVDKLEESSIFPRIDILKLFFDNTGTREVFRKLKGDLQKEEEDVKAVEKRIAQYEQELQQLELDKIMRALREELNQISTESGIETDRYTLEKVSEMTDRIKKQAEVTDLSEEK